MAVPNCLLLGHESRPYLIYILLRWLKAAGFGSKALNKWDLKHQTAEPDLCCTFSSENQRFRREASSNGWNTETKSVRSWISCGCNPGGFLGVPVFDKR